MGEYLEDVSPFVPNTTRSKPLLLYGSAGKANRTRFLTETALNVGFTGVDTANFPTSYNEPHTGDGIAAAIKSGVIKREDLFVSRTQTPSLVPPATTAHEYAEH
jgi:diketogulonate reductase-like aldo/keto reductase